MKNVIVIIYFLIPLSISAQKGATFNVSISSDTVGMNGKIEVTFKIDNTSSKDFKAPMFSGFRVQGPSVSSMTRIVNGDMSRSVSYTYILSPISVGTVRIGSAKVSTDDGTMTTDEKTVVVVEKYDAAVQKNDPSDNLFGSDDFFFRRPTPPQAKGDKPKKKYITEKL